ncbi:MAG TPA: phage replisome organizer N-terminal domain-containing protein, partial [Nitrososphaeraceae archaeon]|nr:phage replisome organizer N-terminal domain-containing protein [Nitrososphaeraceae archaeon]
MAEITWFKVLTDMFSDDKIKIIQSMPEGDSLLVMWFKVLSQAGKTNDGGYIYLKKNIPYNAGMLATLFGKQQQLVEMALRTFSEFGMIDIDDNGYIFVTNWEKHQSIDKLEQIKEKTRLRVQSHRDKKRQELLESNATVTLQVTQGNAIDIDIELDKERDIIPFSEIIEFLNLKASTKFRPSTQKTKTSIQARWNDGYRLDDFKTVIDKKCDEWMNTDMEKYLCPDTLFGTKFEKYLNQRATHLQPV